MKKWQEFHSQTLTTEDFFLLNRNFLSFDKQTIWELVNYGDDQ